MQHKSYDDPLLILCVSIINTNDVVPAQMASKPLCTSKSNKVAKLI